MGVYDVDAPAEGGKAHPIGFHDIIVGRVPCIEYQGVRGSVCSVFYQERGYSHNPEALMPLNLGAAAMKNFEGLLIHHLYAAVLENLQGCIVDRI